MGKAEHQGRAQGRTPGTLPVSGWLAMAAVLLVVLAAYKLLPGQLPNAQSMIGDAAYAQCLRDTRVAGGEGCLNFGYPRGSPKPFGLPVSMAADALFGGDGAVEPSEVRTVYAGFMVLAFALACLLFRRVAGGWPLGVLGAALYLLAPVVQQQSGYGALQLGLALVPGYFLLDVLLLDALRRRRHGLAAMLLAGVACVRVFALFLDGYSFLFGCVLSAVYFALSAVAGRGQRIPAVVALAAHVACSGFAAWVYRQYMPSDALTVMPLDFFRGAGVDVLTMLVPLQWQGLHGLAGLGLDIRPEMSYGGRASLLDTFAGYAYLLALAVLAWGVARRRIAAPGPLACTALLAGLLGVLLSLGPSLKFNDFRHDQTRGSALAFSAYLMPEAAATMPLHTGWIYHHVPGVRNARVLARWQVLARLALVVAMLLVLRALWQGGRRGPAVLLAAFALLEVVPNPLAVAEEGNGARARGSGLPRLRRRVRGARAAGRACLPAAVARWRQRQRVRRQHAVRARCYNAGGDKASIVVEAGWPPEILAAKRGNDIERNLGEAFRKDLVDVVVVPHFDLRHVVYPWWQGGVDRASIARRLAADFGARDLKVREGKDFSIIRAAAAASSEAGVEPH